MMNLEKMKQKKRTNTKSRVKKSLLAATTFLCLTTALLQTQTAYAAENTTPAITIEKPDGWKQGETTIAVTVDASHMCHASHNPIIQIDTCLFPRLYPLTYFSFTDSPF